MTLWGLWQPLVISTIHMIMALWEFMTFHDTMGPMAAPHQIHDWHDHDIMTIHDTTGSFGSTRYFCDEYGMCPRSSTAHKYSHMIMAEIPFKHLHVRPDGFDGSIFCWFLLALPVRICLARCADRGRLATSCRARPAWWTGAWDIMGRMETPWVTMSCSSER